jgi:hypothetical protein
MNPDRIVKNTAPDPAGSKSKTELLAEIPEESVWLANFISANTKRTYLLAVREFIVFHEIATTTADG